MAFRNIWIIIVFYPLFIFYQFYFNCLFLIFFSLLPRNAYRAEIASFLVPVAGEAQSVERIRERIEFTSNLLFLIEDLYLALGPGFVTTQVSTKVFTG